MQARTFIKVYFKKSYNQKLCSVDWMLAYSTAIYIFLENI